VNSANNYVFWDGTQCTQVDQESNLQDGSPCDFTPVYTTGAMTSSTANADDGKEAFSGFSQSGYVMNG